MPRILLIEDDEGCRKFLRKVIEPMKYELVVAEDGPSALAALDTGAFDLVLSDLMVPGEPSGVDMVRQIHERIPDCPIAVVSGYPSSNNLAECERLGIVDFLSKPFELTFVQSLVERLMKEAEKKSETLEA